MKDLIKERDEKEKMEHSIIKWWNVHYMTPEELRAAQQEDEPSQAEKSAQQEGVSEEAHQLRIAEAELHAAEEIIERLQREAQDVESSKRKEIERMRQEVEANAAAGAQAGTQETGETDKAENEQIQSILAEKDDALRDLIEHTEEEM